MELEFLIKSKLAEQGLNTRKLAIMLGTSPQNLTQKLKRKSLNYYEVIKIADLLGYKIEWIKNDKLL